MKGGQVVISEELENGASFGLYVYLMAMVTSLFDSEEVYRDTISYYS